MRTAKTLRDEVTEQNGLPCLNLLEATPDLLRVELTALKELGADLQLTGFDVTELVDIMLGKNVEFKEYDESAADDVQLATCPKCGHTFPK